MSFGKQLCAWVLVFFKYERVRPSRDYLFRKVYLHLFQSLLMIFFLSSSMQRTESDIVTGKVNGITLPSLSDMQAEMQIVIGQII